jgi:hypothetical protein
MVWLSDWKLLDAANVAIGVVAEHQRDEPDVMTSHRREFLS